MPLDQHRPIASPEQLIVLCDLICAHQNVTHWAISMRVAKKGHFFQRLHNGTSPTIRTSQNVLQKFSDMWPDDLAWPVDIERPTPLAPACDAGAPSATRGSVDTPPVDGAADQSAQHGSGQPVASIQMPAVCNGGAAAPEQPASAPATFSAGDGMSCASSADFSFRRALRSLTFDDVVGGVSLALFIIACLFIGWGVSP